MCSLAGRGVGELYVHKQAILRHPPTPTHRCGRVNGEPPPPRLVRDPAEGLGPDPQGWGDPHLHAGLDAQDTPSESKDLQTHSEFHVASKPTAGSEAPSCGCVPPCT